jgi:hypothetical protein
MMTRAYIEDNATDIWNLACPSTSSRIRLKANPDAISSNKIARQLGSSAGSASSNNLIRAQAERVFDIPFLVIRIVRLSVFFVVIIVLVVLVISFITFHFIAT